MSLLGAQELWQNSKYTNKSNKFKAIIQHLSIISMFIQFSIFNKCKQPQGRPDSNRIVSVYRSRVDSCNRLWFVDTGSLEYPENTIQVQPPSIWIFDLNTDSLVSRKLILKK